MLKEPLNEHVDVSYFLCCPSLLSLSLLCLCVGKYVYGICALSDAFRFAADDPEPARCGMSVRNCVYAVRGAVRVGSGSAHDGLYMIALKHFSVQHYSLLRMFLYSARLGCQPQCPPRVYGLF